MKKNLFREDRESFYIFIAQKLISIITNAAKLGIHVEELIP